MSCSSLWSVVDIEGLRFLDALIARSREAPLTFDINFNLAKRKPSTKSLGVSHFGRMRQYRIVGTSAVEQFLRYEHEHPLHAPNLETLELDAEGMDRLYAQVDHEWKTPLPSLVDLVLERVHVLKLSFMFTPSLRHLMIANSAPRLAIDSLLDALAGLPGLQSLLISHSVQSTPGILDEPPTRSVTLRHLTVLGLKDPSDDRHGVLLRLLQCIVCPRDVRLCMSVPVQDGDNGVRAIAALQEHVANRLGVEATPPVMKQCNIHLSDSSVEIRSSVLDPSTTSCTMTWRSEFSCIIFKPNGSATFNEPDLLPRYFHLLCPYDELNTIYVDASPTNYIALFRSAFEAMRNVERLCVDTPSIANQLLAVQPPFPPSTTGSVFFPRLQSIAICEQRVDASTLQAHIEWDDYEKIPEIILQRFLVTRAITPSEFHCCDLQLHRRV